MAGRPSPGASEYSWFSYPYRSLFTGASPRTREQPLRAYNAAVIVDNAIYVDGRRTEEPPTLQETYEAVRDRRGIAWIGLYRPTQEEFASVSEEFGLHDLA